MQIGSQVKCVLSFDGMVSFIASVHGVKLPTKDDGITYLVEGLERCSCNKHDRVLLDGVGAWLDARHFREVEPPLDLEQLMEEVEEKQFELV